MSHIFDVRKKAKLNSDERRRLLTPYETLERLGYKEGRSFADIGSGTGVFTFPAAEIGGAQARIYAVDISPEMLDDIRAQIADKGTGNVIAVQSEDYDFKLEDAAADFILICTVLHEIGDKVRFIREAKRICKPGGKIAVIEFGETDTSFGPPLSHRLPRTQVRSVLTEAGLYDTEALDISSVFYAATGIC
jgi:ubiquinone/menaquinone biosynthesis C-methylase UbiE